MMATQTSRAMQTNRRPGRLALPAHARELIALRDAGQHPRLVVVVVGARYATRAFKPLAARLKAPAPLMALADEIEARALSWFILRGLGAVLCNADGDRLARAIYIEAAAQLAQEAAPVLLFGGGALDDPDTLAQDAGDLLFDAKFDDAGGRWPAGWTDAKNADYQARADRWFAESPT